MFFTSFKFRMMLLDAKHFPQTNAVDEFTGIDERRQGKSGGGAPGVRSAFGGGLRFILNGCLFDRRPKAGVEKPGCERKTHPVRYQMSRLRCASLDKTELASEGLTTPDEPSHHILTTPDT